MAVLGIHHAAIIVPDLAKALAFYDDVLGFDVVETADIEPSAEAEAILQLESPHAKSVILKSGYGYLELFEYTGELASSSQPKEPVNQLGLRHICLAVDDCRSEYERLKSHMSFHCEPKNLGWGPGGDGPWVTYGRDPFGNIIELWELTPEDPPLFAPETTD